MTPFERLIEVMRRLRGEGGCPWDRQQTRESLTPFLLEETHEVLEAIEQGQPPRLKDELGDLLFQVVFHAQIAAEAGEFTIDQVVEATADKMTRRHPHVFGPLKSGGDAPLPPGPPSPRSLTPDDVLGRWEEMKRAEAGASGRTSVVDGVPRTLPALLRAHQVQAKASRVGFDWPGVAPVKGKVMEEWRELMEAIDEAQPRSRQEAELGDLLFAVVNLARYLRVDPEEALQRATGRFADRFRRMERLAQEQGRPLSRPARQEGDGPGWSLDELDRLWEQAKQEQGQSEGSGIQGPG